MNQVSIVGNLTRDARLIDLKGGGILALMTIAVNYVKKSGERGTDFIPVKTVISKNAAKYLTKGKKVAIAGRLTSYTKDDRTNIIVNATNIQFLSKQPSVTTEETNGETVEIPPEILEEPF